MYYLFHKDELKENGIDYKELIKEGIVKNFDDCYVSSTLEVISYNGKEVENLQGIDLWIGGFYEDEETRISGIRITMDEVLDVLLNDMTDEDEERIVNAERPQDEAVKLFDKAKEKTIIERQKQAMKDFEEALQKLKDGTLEWR
jgi:hypothetical protein